MNSPPGPDPLPSRRGDPLLTAILLPAALLAGGIYLFFSFQRFFMLDDFPLFLQADTLASLLDTVGGRLKPIARLHFLALRALGAGPVLFNLVSLALHAAAAFALYLALKRSAGPGVGLPAALLFFGHFSHNEAVFWVSAAPVLYCMVFCCFAVFWVEKAKPGPALACLVFASLSYELWLVLPVYFLLARRWRWLCAAAALAAVHAAAALLTGVALAGYGGAPAAGEIPLRLVFYGFRALFPFTAYPPFPFALLLLAAAVAAGMALWRRGRAAAWALPLSWYGAPALIFLFSSRIPSRFFYFPAAAVAVALVSLARVRSRWRYLGLALIAYSALLSVLLNVQDGRDYRAFAAEGKDLLRWGEAVREAETGDRVLVVDRIRESIPARHTRRHRGRPKLLFERRGGLGGLIYPRDYVDFLLKGRGLHAVPARDCRGALRVDVGTDEPVSRHCFRIAGPPRGVAAGGDGD